jgi:hypothetical protein
VEQKKEGKAAGRGLLFLGFEPALQPAEDENQ